MATVTNASRSYTHVLFEEVSMSNVKIDDTVPNSFKFYTKDSWSFLRTHNLEHLSESMIRTMAKTGIRIVAD